MRIHPVPRLAGTLAIALLVRPALGEEDKKATGP